VLTALLALVAAACSQGASTPAAGAAVELDQGDVRLVTASVGGRPSGWIVDRADLLDPREEARLAARLDAHEAASSDQIIVVTVTNVQGMAIERFGYTLGNHWGVGRADADNGVLMILALEDRKIRIEVGSGLERILTDDRAAQIIQLMRPQLVASDFAGAVDRGTAEIIATLRANVERRHAA
jgi:uncharacterized protein